MRRKNLKLLNIIFYFLVIVLIVMLLFYDRAYYLNITKTKFTEENYEKNPELYGNHKAERLAKIINISEDHFYIRLGNKNVKVIGSNVRMPVIGESVFFLNYRKDGIIELIDYHSYDNNYVLYSISVIAIIIFIIILFKEWKLTARGFENA